MHSQNSTQSYKIWKCGSYDISLKAILINHNVYDMMKVSALLLYMAKEIISYTIQSNYDDYDDDYDDEGFFNDFCNGVCDDHEIDERRIDWLSHSYDGLNLIDSWMPEITSKEIWFS